MSGHSHSANIKHRKDRQDSARSQLFLKLRKKIENIIRDEGEVNEKSLSLARENQFPKDKVYQIWEKIKESKENSATRVLYQGLFGILFYCESDIFDIDNLVDKFKLKKLSLSSLPSFFQLLYSLKLQLKEVDSNLEDYLLISLPSDIWEKISYDEKEKKIISPQKEAINLLKSQVEKGNLKLIIEEENSFWKPLIPHFLVNQDEKEYYLALEKALDGQKFYTNVAMGL